MAAILSRGRWVNPFQAEFFRIDTVCMENSWHITEIVDKCEHAQGNKKFSEG